MSTSLDGGHTFINSDFANVPLSLLAECRLGFTVDQQSLTADPAVANRYYIAWRHRGSEVTVNGACGVEFDVDPNTGLTTFSGAPTSVATVIPVSHELLGGVGGLLTQKLGAQVTVAYADTDSAAAATNTCNSSGGHVGTTWRSITSFIMV